MSRAKRAPAKLAVKHKTRFAVGLPQHEGARNVYLVHDCSCGWQSPLCQTSDRAREAFYQHRGAA